MILDEIVKSTRIRVKKAYETVSLEEMKKRAIEKHEHGRNISADADLNNTNAKYIDFAFEKALKKKPIAFICEVKKASPSKGLIAKDFDYVCIAKEYESAGASCISVLTEPEFFMGSNDYLREISKNVSIPLLRKDFVIDEYQIYEAKVIGASAVLLICAILSDEQMKKYIAIANSLGLSAVVEAHDEEEVLMAKRCGARIIGVNNRNLKDFTVDINNSLRYRKMVDDNVLFISESGIKNADDIKRLVDNHVNAVLIGETLMRSDNKAAMIEELLAKVVYSKTERSQI